MTRSAPIMAVLATALLATGCGKTERTFHTPGGKVKVKTEKSLRGEKQSLEVKAKEGTVTFTAGEKRSISESELGVPVYPGAKVESTSSVKGGAGGNSGTYEQYMLSTDDSYDKVLDFYKSNLKDVKTSYVGTQGETRSAMFSMGNGKKQTTVHILNDRDKKQTIIQVMKIAK